MKYPVKYYQVINDHTQGLSRGNPSPFAQVADNDLAAGMFVGSSES